MSENNTRLRIHAQLTPDTKAEPSVSKAPRFRTTTGPRKKLTFTDRLLRNSALACALLLGILALGNIDQPWAQRTSETIERALTMHIDLDESIGQLSFVRRLMPESALVFLNLSGESEFTAPITGHLTHAYTETQPWLMFVSEESESIRAVSSGTVTAVSKLSDGSYGILIDHGGGLESVYAYVSDASVQSGDTVSRNQAIATSFTLYFELRDGGKAIDPTERLGLHA